MTEKQKCPDCKDGYLKFFNGRYSLRCIPCASLHSRKMDKIYKEQKLDQKEIKILPDRVCKKCNKYFMPNRQNQVYCKNPCLTLKYNKQTEAERWIAKRPR